MPHCGWNVCNVLITPFPGSGAVHRQSIQMNDDADNNADDDGADQLTVTFAAAEGTKGGGFAGVAFKMFELFCTFFLKQNKIFRLVQTYMMHEPLHRHCVISVGSLKVFHLMYLM